MEITTAIVNPQTTDPNILPDTPPPSESPESLPIEGSLVIHRIRQELHDGTSYSLAEVMQAVMLMSRNLGEAPRII